ncbi:hypothetical protein [Mesonia sp. HuA40]|uniref:hypothetical protein n=1 Tax=Mesonia sp. HuA40 TaxID=2602761 RepID=UPI0011CA3F1E|nr:hypothetical protein [Mesonia sp. HuA40]TXK73307.1 hypothetical protein FT993_05860 [Mesonia sp. HuA40]
MKFSNDFKEAVLALSQKEKDQLLLRLLKKDKNLIKQLHFRLIDDKNVDERRAILEQHILKISKKIAQESVSLNQLKVFTSRLSSEISDHSRTTKDQFGEVYLNLLMLNTLLKYGTSLFENSNHFASQKFYIYIIKRIFKCLVQIKKMHEDLHLEFQPLLEELTDHLVKNELLTKMCIHHGLDFNWLNVHHIPEDIVGIQKELKQAGFL